ncbi:zinc finger protein 665-like [Sitodiplosis mosellana]|uniref:zinc finger protein 665-like n=1 Tax=Sitodiplosis mosellana TaxID=263140 RepID=UPI00244518BD|nr:zinc finger protein 665-like [Sitodiplosis mosellana]
MCFTIDQIEQACGFVLLNESNTFVYCCNKCQCEYDSGSNLEVHFLSEHQDDKTHIENLFVNDGILVEDCTLEPPLQDFSTEVTNEALQHGSISKIELIIQAVEEKYGQRCEIEAKNQHRTDEEMKYKRKASEETKNKRKTNKEIKIDANVTTKGGVVQSDEDLQSEEIKLRNGFELKPISQSPTTTSALLDSDKESHDSIIDKELAKLKPKKSKRCKTATKNQKSKEGNSDRQKLKGQSRPKQVYYCEMCPDITLSTFNILQAHMRKHRDNRFLTKRCQICNKKARNLEKHMRLNHLEERPYKCDFCGNCYRTNNNRLNHMRVHTLERPFLCETCGKDFTSLSSKTKHIKQVHTKIREYQCPQCDRAFIIPCRLQEHIYAFHSGQRPFVCDICGDAFSTTSNLRNHKLIHGERTKQCGYCEKKFKTNRTRRSHEKAVHKITNDLILKRNKWRNLSNQPLAYSMETALQSSVDVAYDISIFRHFEMRNLYCRGFSMCFTVDQIERACGLLLLNESNTFVYCCKSCQSAFDSGSYLEVHILSAHQDDKSHVESVFVDDETFVDDDYGQEVENCYTTGTMAIKLEPFDIKTENDVLEDDAVKDEIVIIGENLEPNSYLSLNNGNDGKNNRIDETTSKSDIHELKAVLKTEKKAKKSTEEQTKKGPKREIIAEPSTPPKLFHCEWCPQVEFNDKRKIRNHMNIHIKKKIFYVCTYRTCGQKYTNFEKHMKGYHKMKQPYKCNDCDAAFSTHSGFTRHLRMHAGEEPFECEFCFKTFGCKATWRRHEMLKHLKGAQNICEYCNRPFFTKTLLARHVNKAHLKIETHFAHKCNECGKSFAAERSLRSHAKFHTEPKCKYCPQVFKTYKARRQHQRMQHELEDETPEEEITLVSCSTLPNQLSFNK